MRFTSGYREADSFDVSILCDHHTDYRAVFVEYGCAATAGFTAAVV